MNDISIAYKKILGVLSASLLAASIILFLAGFLCIEGLLGEIVLSSLLLATLAISFSRNSSLKRIAISSLVIIPIIYSIIIPIGMLSHIYSGSFGGFNFFLTERLDQYIFQIGTALAILIPSSILYSKEKSVHTGTLKANLLSALSISLIIRLLWMIIFESGNLLHFSLSYPYLGVEFVVLSSIPLFIGVFILSVRKILIGYQLGIIAGLVHVALVLFMVIMGMAPGFGPIIVFLSSLAITIFSFKGVRDYYFNNNLDLPRFGQFIMKNILKLRNNPRKIRNVLLLAGLKTNMKVLDYGCGIGNYSMESSGIVGSSGAVVSVDINDEMLHELETRSKSKGITNIEIQKIYSVEDIEENSFDFILLIDVLHLVEEKFKMVNSLSEKLSKSGILLVKFEHFAKYQRSSLLEKLDNLDINYLTKDYWILSRKNVRMEK